MSSESAALYADSTWAATNATRPNGSATYNAAAYDSLGRTDTNTVSANLPNTVTYTHDLNGNLTSDGTRYFAYDDENQLTSVLVTNAWRSDFVYDGRMRRRKRIEYTWSSAWVQTNEVHYLYDGDVVIQERDANNLPIVSYTRGKDLRGTLQGAGGIGGLLARTDHGLLTIGNSGAHAYYHADGNGNVTALINTYQALVAKYLYDPFGNILSQAGLLADANVYRFSSKEFHRNSAMVYYLYRFYDSNFQRWLNREPIGELGDINLYRFVYNDPVDDWDFLGLDTFLQNRLIGGNVPFPKDNQASHTFVFTRLCLPRTRMAHWETRIAGVMSAIREAGILINRKTFKPPMPLLRKVEIYSTRSVIPRSILSFRRHSTSST